MFDKLIESDTAGADFKNRSRYFMVSTIVVGILFLTAVVYSLYASDVGLGNTSFDIAELVAPLDNSEPQIPEPRTQTQQASHDQNNRANQHSVLARTDEPTIAPTSVSVVQSPVKARDWRPLNLNLPESNGPVGYPISTNNGGPSGTSSSTLGTYNDGDDDTTKGGEPPPLTLKKPPTTLRTSKVLNGEAISLPKPTYPQPAVILNLQGSVKVQVTIDEKGNVISAKAADGHPFFRLVSEQAARSARFRPTLLNDEPVKVTGVIVYNFKRN
jgi:TonB family protein